MREFMEGCSIPKKETMSNDIRHGCTSTWGDPHTVTECTTCKLPDEIKKKCKCYSNYELKEIQNCPETVKNSRLMGDQFCAYEDDDGTLIGCGPGCCDPDGCPGECCKGSLRPPDKNRPSSTSTNPLIINKTSTIKPNVINFIMFLLGLLIIVNMILLIIQ